MTLWRITLKEIIRRPLGLLLAVVAVALATAAFVAVETISWSVENQIRKLMLQLGLNVLIVPKDAPQDRLWATDFGEKVMPEEYLQRVAEAPDIAALRYVGILERRVEVDGHVAALTGVRFELGEYGRLRQKEPTPAGFDVYDVKKPDQAYLGADIARYLKVEKGDSITVEGQGFRVTSVRPPTGTIDDIRIYIQLKEAQKIYDKPEQINALLALGCVCPVTGQFTVLSFIQLSLQNHFDEVAEERGLEPPDVIMLRDKFEARAESRLMVESYGAYLSAGLWVLCGQAVALYMFAALWKRRRESALLIALGYRPWQVVLGLLAKVALVSVLGGIGGMLLGVGIAVNAGPRIVGMYSIDPRWALWYPALGFALTSCLAAAVVSVLGALLIAPAKLLRNA